MDSTEWEDMRRLRKFPSRLLRSHGFEIVALGVLGVLAVKI
jgi:hypothetical protein